MTTALIAAVLVVGSVAAVSVAFAGLRGFTLWLAYRRERATGQPEGVAELAARLKDLETKFSGEQLQKLRR